MKKIITVVALAALIFTGCSTQPKVEDNKVVIKKDTNETESLFTSTLKFILFPPLLLL